METTLQTIRWRDTKEELTVLFGISDSFPEEDDDIFFYIESMEEIENLKQEDNGEEFIII